MFSDFTFQISWGGGHPKNIGVQGDKGIRKNVLNITAWTMYQIPPVFPIP